MTDAPAAENATPSVTTKTQTAEEHVNVSIEENEIRVTAHGKIRNYVAYAATIFSEGKSHTVVLKGMGRVINKTVSLAEILKRRVKGLYQCAEIGSIQVSDKRSADGEEESETDVLRLLSVIKIVLTTEPEDKARFQPPLDETQVRTIDEEKIVMIRKIQEEPLVTSAPKKGRANKNWKVKKAKNEAKEAAEDEKATETEKPAEESPAKEKSGRGRHRKKAMSGKAKESTESGDDKKNALAANAKQQKRRKNRKAKKETEKGAEVVNGAETQNPDPTDEKVTQETTAGEVECT